MDPESRLDVLRGVVKESAVDNQNEVEDEKKEDIFEKKVQFHCSLCGLCEVCQYKGTNPPFVKNLMEFTESCYVMVDPFTPRQANRFGNNFLVLGGECSSCNVSVCVECSIFFTKRFCVNCAQFNINEFPKDIQSRIVKLAENFAKQKYSTS